MDFLTKTEDGVEIRVKVIPRSSRSEVAGVVEDRLKIKLNSPPVDGAANKELIKLLSKQLGVAKSKVKIVRGDRMKRKTVQVRDLSIDSSYSSLLK